MMYKAKICVIDPKTCLVEHWEGKLEPKESSEFSDLTLIEKLVNSYFSNIFSIAFPILFNHPISLHNLKILFVLILTIHD